MSSAPNGHPRELLSAYLDDELGVEERTTIDRHLADCEDCRVELEALRRLARAIGDEGVPPVPLDLAARVERRLNAATIAPSRRSRFVVPATIAATLGAIGILVALQWREGRLGAPPPSVIPEEKVAERPEKESVHRQELDEKSKLKQDEDVPADALGAVVGSVASVGAAEPAVPAEPERRDRTSSKVMDEAVAVAPRAAAAKPEMESVNRQELDEKFKLKKDEDVPADALGAVVGGVASVGAAEPAAPAAPSAPADLERRDRESSKVMNEAVAVAPKAAAAKSEAVPSCMDRWSDSGLRGSWAVPDVDAAERELGRIAHAVSGIGLWRGVAEGRPYVVVVPRARFEEVFYTLRARGVAGLVDPPSLADVGDCTGISIALTVVTEQTSPAPR